MRNTAAAPLSSVDNALQVLQLLRSQPAMRLSDVATELGVANSTAHRLLSSLVARGFVAQEPDGRRYVAGPQLLELGRSAVLHQDLRIRARPTLEAIAQELGETVHLGVREARAVRYVDAVESARAVRVAGRTGRSLPAHWTSTGKVLLAALDDDTVRRLYGTDGPPSRGGRSIGEIDVLLAQLADCRRHGYAVNSGESEDDVVSVAIPLLAHSGVVAAVGCAAPQHRLHLSDAAKVAEVMRSCAAAYWTDL